jgi:hypothetical protein
VSIKTALQKLKATVEQEKKQLDYILQGAQLLADLLEAENKSGNKEQDIQYSEPGLEEAPGTGQRNAI